MADIEALAEAVRRHMPDESEGDPRAELEAVFHEIADRLGYDVEDETGEDDFALEDQGEDAEGDEGEDADEWVPGNEQEEAGLDVHEAHIHNGLVNLADELGLPLSEEALALLFEHVLSLPPTSEKLGDVRTAFAGLLDAIEEAGTGDSVYATGRDAHLQKTARAAFRAQQAESRRAAAE
jgi:hypothetical protein